MKAPVASTLPSKCLDAGGFTRYLPCAHAVRLANAARKTGRASAVFCSVRLTGKIGAGKWEIPAIWYLAPARIRLIANEEGTLPEAEQWVDHHVGFRGEHDDRRVVSCRRKRLAGSEEAEVLVEVVALPAGEPDHLDQVPVVDPIRIQSFGKELELSGAALRVP